MNISQIGFEDIVGETSDIVGDISIGALLDHAADEMICGDPQTALAELAIARQSVPNAIAVFHRKLRNRRRQPLGFALAEITNAIGANAIDVAVKAAPQQLFKAKRLVIPSAVSGGVPGAQNLAVVDVKVGNKSQLVGTEEPVCGAMFSELAVNTFVDFLTADVGNTIGVILRNVNATVSVALYVTMVGVVAEP